MPTTEYLHIGKILRVLDQTNPLYCPPNVDRLFDERVKRFHARKNSRTWARLYSFTHHRSASEIPPLIGIEKTPLPDLVVVVLSVRLTEFRTVPIGTCDQAPQLTHVCWLATSTRT